MASLVLSGDTSGSVTLAAPAVAGSTTQTLVNVTGTLAPIVSGTAQASTSGTSIDFTGIPSWVKRITVMFQGVSVSGTSAILIQGGNSGGIVSTGYISTSIEVSTTSGSTGLNSTAGFIVFINTAAKIFSGAMTLVNLNGSTWVSSHSGKSTTVLAVTGGGDGSISSLTQIRITTVNGTDTFDAGSINILYE